MAKQLKRKQQKQKQQQRYMMQRQTSETSFTLSLSSYSDSSNMKSMSSLNYNNSNRIVSFDRCVRAKKVLHLSDYTDREKEACWYDIDEIEDIQRSANAAAAAVQHGEETDGEPSSFTVEALSSPYRNEAKWEILKEQKKQNLSGIKDQEKIANLYRKTSKVCVVEARNRALINEMEVIHWVATSTTQEETTPTLKETILGDVNVCADRASTLLEKRRKERLARTTSARRVATTAA